MKLFRIVVFSLVSVFFVNPVASALEPAAHITFIEGDVSIKRAAGESINPDLKTPLYEGDKLITGEYGKVKLLFHSGAILQLQNNTKFMIRKHRNNKRKQALLILFYGKIKAIVKSIYKKKGNKFTIKSKHMTMGVRGTFFDLSFNRKSQKTDLKVYRGSVNAVTAKHPEGIMIPSGRMLEMSGSFIASKRAVRIPNIRTIRPLNTISKPVRMVQNITGLPAKSLAGSGSYLTRRHLKNSRDGRKGTSFIGKKDSSKKKKGKKDDDDEDDLGNKNDSKKKEKEDDMLVSMVDIKNDDLENSDEENFIPDFLTEDIDNITEDVITSNTDAPINDQLIEKKNAVGKLNINIDWN